VRRGKMEGRKGGKKERRIEGSVMMKRGKEGK